MADFSWMNKITAKPAQKGAWLAIALTIVAGFEGMYTHPYRDVVGVQTVCYGETAADHVEMKTYTPDQCKALLAASLPKYDAMIQKCLSPAVYAALPANRHAALVSFTYNVGGGAFCKSSVVRDLNAGNVTAGCNDLMKFNKAGGRTIKGLTTRREAERKRCLLND